METTRLLGILAMVYTALVLLSILVNPRAKNPLEWMWPPTTFKRLWEVMTRPNYVPDRSGNRVLGSAMRT